MSTLSLRQVIDGYVNLSETAFQKLNDLAKLETFKKGEFITKTGKFNEKEYVVLNGVCRTCIFSHDGEDTTLRFFVSGSVLSPYVIRVRSEQSVLNIQASTDLELISFDAKQFEELMVENLEIRGFGNEVLKRELVQMFQKEIGFASLTAKERLVSFRSVMPMLENMVSHGEIASYLGITTISLSRLRKELMQ